jgi:hypothetical protein
MVFSHLLLGFPNVLFPSGFSGKCFVCIYRIYHIFRCIMDMDMDIYIYMHIFLLTKVTVTKCIRKFY